MHDVLLTLPLTDPVLVLSVALSVILLVPLLFERLRMPGLVGLIIAGIVIGPHGLNLIARDRSIILLATVGLMYVMFIAGLEIDLTMFKKHRRQSVVFGILCFLIPGLLGTLAGLWLGFSPIAALLLGSVIAPHTLLAYPIVSRMGLTKRVAVTTAVGGTILTDTLALMLLAVVAGAVGGDLDAWFWVKTLGSLAICSAGIVWLVPRLGRWVFKHANLNRDQELVFVLAVLLISGAVAKLFGVEAIIGAFLAGLTLNRLVPEHSPLVVRLHAFGNALFIPFFLLATGMLVDLRVLLLEARSWVVAGTIVGVAIGGKWLANWLVGWFYGYSHAARWTMFGLTVSHAAATLAVAMTGHKLGLFGVDTINGVIVMMLATCLLGAFITQRFGAEMAAEQRSAANADDVEQPERILLPIANPETSASLMELALLLRQPHGTEPLMPLMVVQPVAGDMDPQVANAEHLLTHAVASAASADVPVLPLTRISFNVAAAIKQTAAETRTSLIVLGWHGRASIAEKAFGSTISQTLSDSTSMVLVSRVGAALNTINRVLLLIPPSALDHPRHRTALRLVERLTGRLGAALVIMPVANTRQQPDALGAYFPSLSATCLPVETWQEVPRTLNTSVRRDDLVILLSAREGSLSWQPVLDKLPRLIADKPERNFLVLYPPELDDVRGDDWVPPAVKHPRHQIRALQATTVDGALDELYAVLPAGRTRLQTTWRQVVPGAVVAGTRLPDWPELTVVVGVSKTGLPHGDAAGPIHVVLLCVTPAGMPLDQQSTYLHWIANQITQQGVSRYLHGDIDRDALQDLLPDSSQ